MAIIPWVNVVLRVCDHFGIIWLGCGRRFATRFIEAMATIEHLALRAALGVTPIRPEGGEGHGLKARPG